jgi:hypothetical protein
MDEAGAASAPAGGQRGKPEEAPNLGPGTPAAPADRFKDDLIVNICGAFKAAEAARYIASKLKEKAGP